MRSDVPVLLFSGYYDPSTPAGSAAEVAAEIPNSRHILVRNQSHGAGLGCAREQLIEFLISGSLEGLGPACEDTAPVKFNLGNG